MYALYLEQMRRSAATATSMEKSVTEAIGTDTSTITPTTEVTETITERRPFDRISEAGPAAEPLSFPEPTWGQGQRIMIRYYDPEKKSFVQAWNVLISSSYMNNPSRVQQAYLPIKGKKKKKTRLGYVEFCNVLRKQGDDFQLTDKIAVVKVSYWSRMTGSAEDPRKEVAAMQLIGNDLPNVLGFIDALSIPNKSLNIILPFCRDGDFFNAFKNEVCSEERARDLFRQVIQGLQQLHSKGICHRDLSLENVMLDDNKSVVIDLGMSLRMPYSPRKDSKIDAVTDISNGEARRLIKPQNACGKPGYISPEIYQSRNPFDGEAIDVWSAGVILYGMITGFGSYQWPKTDDVIFVHMANHMSPLLRNWNSDVSDQAIDLMVGMLQVDPRLRLSTDEVLNHKWFKNSQ